MKQHIDDGETTHGHHPRIHEQNRHNKENKSLTMPPPSSHTRQSTPTPHKTHLGAKDAVKVVDVPQAITPQIKAAGTLPQPIIHCIKCTLACIGHAGVAVGDDDLGNRHAMHNGTHTPTVVVGNVVENETLFEIEAHMKVPLLPRNHIAVDLLWG